MMVTADTSERVFLNARLGSGEPLVDLNTVDGRVAAILAAKDSRPAYSDVDTVDLRGALTLPSLVESHVHLEKAYLLERMPRPASSLTDAIRLTSEAKTSFTPADMRQRALRFLRAALKAGVTHVRAHVEIDDVLSLSAVETMIALRDEVRGLIDLQLVVFPQEGLLAQRTAVQLLDEAARLGVDVIGGIPYADQDQDAHLRIVFDAAERFALPIDFHADLSDDPGHLSAETIARAAIERGMQGRVVIGHLTALGSADPDRALEVAELLAEAGVSVITLPLTDLYLGGRGDITSPRRGLAPVRMLNDAGVNVALSTNNVQNAFTPFGRGNILDAALVLAAAAHLGTTDDMELLMAMMTTNAAKAIGLEDYGIHVGARADFTAFDAAAPRELVGDVVSPALTVKAGRVVSHEMLAA